MKAIITTFSRTRTTTSICPSPQKVTVQGARWRSLASLRADLRLRCHDDLGLAAIILDCPRDAHALARIGRFGRAELRPVRAPDHDRERLLRTRVIEVQETSANGGLTRHTL